MEGPYRSPRCEDCVRRDEAAEAMQPFQAWGDRRCPACGNPNMVTMWQTVCEGGQSFVVKTGYWLFKRFGEELFTCDVTSPRHLHMSCSACSHRWTMLTRLEPR